MSKKILLGRRELVIGLAAGTIFPLAGCADNAALGRTQLMLVSDAEINRLSATAWRDTPLASLAYLVCSLVASLSLKRAVWPMHPRARARMPDARPARAPAMAAAGELAGLPRVCPPAAGRRLKTRVVGCCRAGRSLVVWL